jgi:hypothetical protein
MTKIPINREDDGVLLGVIEKTTTGWTAQTIFGYIFARSETQEAAEETVRSQGLSELLGLWHYQDKKDKVWHPCILQEVYENKVTVIRTNEMGYQDSQTYKRVTISNPNETNLVKS